MSLKHVIAVVRADTLEAVERSLMKIGVHGLTVVKVRGLGTHANYFARDWLMEETKVEIFADEAKVDAIVHAIMDAAHTGDPGDGLVAVAPVDKLYRIRTRSECAPDEA